MALRTDAQSSFRRVVTSSKCPTSGDFEHALELVDIDLRSLQAAQTDVVVAAVADDEGELASHKLLLLHDGERGVGLDSSARHFQ